MKRVSLATAIVALAWAANAAGQPTDKSAETKHARCRGSQGYAYAKGGYRTFFWRPEWLNSRKRMFASDDAARMFLRRSAEAALREPPLSVRDKTALPASGDRGDYYSIGPYWWPDPARPDGLPYLRRDGRVNPQRSSDAFDNDRLGRFIDRIERLALSSYYLGDPRYARHAATLLRVWFLDPRTRMNPNLDFGQAIPGVAAGRAEGLIDMAEMGGVIDAIGLIEAAGFLTPGERQGLRNWFGQFVTWMMESPIGRDERSRRNNHALFYDYMLTHFALFAGKQALATDIARAFPERLIRQMDARGLLPEEIARTRSWHYSVYALTGAARMATIGECVGVNIWSARAKDGRGLKRGLDALLSYQSRRKQWPHPDTTLDEAVDPALLTHVGSELFSVAAWGSDRADYARAAGDEALKQLWTAPLPETDTHRK